MRAMAERFGIPDSSEPHSGRRPEHDGRLRAILETTHEAFVSMDSGGFIVEWNHQAERTFGWSREEAIGRVLADTIIPPQHREAHWRGLNRFLETGAGRVLDRRMEISALHREGYEFPVELTISVTYTDGQPQFHAFLHDITARKRAEEELEITRELAVAIGGAESVRHALLLTLGALCERTGWAVGEAWVPHGEGLRRKSEWTLVDAMEPFLQAAGGATVDSGEDLAGRALQQRVPVWIREVSSMSGFARAEAARAAGLASALAVPVLAGSEVVAVITLYAAIARAEDARLSGLVEAVANQLGTLIKRKRVEESLATRELQLSHAQRVARIGSWEWDLAADEIVWSEELYRIYGLTQGDFDGTYEAFLAHVHPEDRERVDTLVQQRLRDRRPLSFDHRVLLPGEEVRIVHGEGEVIIDASGAITGMRGTAQDVTDQRRLEAKSAGLWNLSLDLFAILDPEGCLLGVNPAHQRVLGYAQEELVGRRFVDLVHPDDRDGLLAEAQRLAAGEHDTSELELRVRHLDGSYRTVLRSARTNAVEGVVYTVAKDVTDRRRASEKLDLARDLALSIAAAETAEQATRTVLEQMCERGGWSLGQAWRCAPGGECLEYGAGWYQTDDGLEPFRRRSAAMVFERWQGLPGKAWATRGPVWISDLASDPARPRALFARDVGIGAALAVPVLAHAEVVGVLEFFACEQREEDHDLIGLISSAASQLGSLIERKYAEQALRTSEERFRLLVDGVEEYAIIVLDQYGNVASWNHGAARITGYRAQEIIGYHLSRFYPHEAVEQAEPERNLEVAGATGRYATSEWLVRSDGLRFWADIAITPLRNGGGETVQGFGCVVRDRTEARRIETELQRLSALVEHSDDAIIGTTVEKGIVTDWNPGAERLLGYSAREMLGRSIAIVVPPEERAMQRDVLERVMEGTRVEHYETQALRKNGTRVDISVTVSPIRDSTGTVIGVSSIARDVTDRLRAEQYVQQAFGTYVDPGVVDHILRQGPALAGKEVEVSMVFVDIRDFTSFAGRCHPSEVVATLNCLFEEIVPIISRHGGHVDKFVGDGLLAVFGAPERLVDHADRALEAAVAIDRCARRRFEGDLEIAIGIDSGNVVAGNVGGGGRLDFTVIGDAVNTASRVEAATRTTGDTILITERTTRLLRPDHPPLEARPAVVLKGMQEPIALYAPRLEGA